MVMKDKQQYVTISLLPEIAQQLVTQGMVSGTAEEVLGRLMRNEIVCPSITGSSFIEMLFAELWYLSNDCYCGFNELEDYVSYLTCNITTNINIDQKRWYCRLLTHILTKLSEMREEFLKVYEIKQ